MSIEAMKLALEALELAGGNLCEALHHPKKLQHGIGEPCPAVAKYDAAITSLRQAIEKAQEPVAHWSDCAAHSEPAYPKGECDCGGFAAPPQRQPLTDEEIDLLLINYGMLNQWPQQIHGFVRAIEVVYGIKGEA